MGRDLAGVISWGYAGPVLPLATVGATVLCVPACPPSLAPREERGLENGHSVPSESPPLFPRTPFPIINGPWAPPGVLSGNYAFVHSINRYDEALEIQP